MFECLCKGGDITLLTLFSWGNQLNKLILDEMLKFLLLKSNTCFNLYMNPNKNIQTTASYKRSAATLLPRVLKVGLQYCQICFIYDCWGAWSADKCPQLSYKGNAGSALRPYLNATWSASGSQFRPFRTF